MDGGLLVIHGEGMCVDALLGSRGVSITRFGGVSGLLLVGLGWR